MDIIKEYRRFVSSYYLGEGLRITAGAVLPALVFSWFDLLSIGVLVSLGAVCVSTADSPGPVHHRRNGMRICIAVIFFAAIITGWTAAYPVLLGIWIAAACFIFSIIGVYGGRATSIGIAGLLILTLNMSKAGAGWQILWNALYITGGGIWYMLLSLGLYHVRPYRLIQQVLGECISETAAYLRIRAGFYETGADHDAIYRQLMEQQVVVQQQQDLLRELLYKSRTLIKDSTVTSRTLMMLFIDTVDLFEKSSTSFYPYEQLHLQFEGQGILEDFHRMVLATAEALDETGIAVKSGRTAAPPDALQQQLSELQQKFLQYRDRERRPDTLEGLITLRKILQSLEDMASRIESLHHLTRYDKRLTSQYQPSGDHQQFVTPTEISWKQLEDNLSIDSDVFRHALRVSIAAVAGYVLSHLLNLGHGYWILLTIIVILKPAYSITKKRNYQRVLGTIGGALAGLLILFLVKDNRVLFGIMLLLMIATYSVIRINYLLAVIFMTPYILLLFHLLDSHHFAGVLRDRVIDTVIGSSIAFAANFLLLPVWEQDQIRKYQAAAIGACREYFDAVALPFVGTAVADTAFRLSRKKAFVALANLSDAFSRLLAEPKRKQTNSRTVHQFVVLTHMLNSHIASLGHFGKTLSGKYQSDGFMPIIERTRAHLDNAVQQFSTVQDGKQVSVAELGNSNISQQVKQLLEKRKQEISDGLAGNETRIQLSELKPIADQFMFISGIAADIDKLGNNEKV